MTKCDKCHKEVGPLFCAHCRDRVKKEGAPEGLDLIPVLYWIPAVQGYVAGCTCRECPWNRGGYCSTVMTSLEMFKMLCHEFDGDNCIHQACG